MVNHLLLGVIFTLLNFAHGETFVTINNKTTKLTKNSKCRYLTQNNNDLCDCCFIKQTSVLKHSDKKASKICIVRHQCILYSKERGLTGSPIARARKNLNYMPVIKINDFKEHVSIPQNGVLTKESVEQIVIALNDADHIRLPKNFLANHTINELGKTHKGYHSGQLFTISYNNGLSQEPLYFLKETKKGLKEIKHLYKIANSSLKEQKQSQQHEDIAQISFHELHFKIKTNGCNRYFSLLQTASGKSLHYYLLNFSNAIKQYHEDDDEFKASLNKMKHIFYRLGHSLSLLHQTHSQQKNKRILKKTYIHGDCHSDNIFYDQATDNITMIDNETFSYSLTHQDYGVNDLVDLYISHTFKTLTHIFTKQLKVNKSFGIPDQLWHDLWYELITGYIKAYNPSSKGEFINIFIELEKRFMSGLNNNIIFRDIRNIFDQRKLKRLGLSHRRIHLKRVVLIELFNRVLKDNLHNF